MLEQIQSLPIEKKIGQLFFIGLPGTEIEEESKKLLKEISPGGICLFARNIRTAEQTRKFLDNIRQVLPVEPLVSIDQEGGLVDRLRRITTPLPSANSIKTTEEAKKIARIIAEILRILGFNMNFAPVVDVIDEVRGKFSNGLYSRTFGKSKEEVVRFAGAFLETLQKEGCIGCLKHFPGLGASRVDSHEDLPFVDLNREELFAEDLQPYQNLFQVSPVKAVMVAHAAFPNFDLQEIDSNGKLLPSSLSHNFVTKLLRDEFGFQGLILTDDLEMGAITKNYGIGEACKLAVNAGENMLVICSNPNFIREGFSAVLDAVEKGEITESRIDDSIYRIVNLKSLIQPPLPLNIERLYLLANNIAELNKQLNYSYGG